MRFNFGILTAAALSFGFAQTASAADMPVKAPMKAPPPAAAVYNWTGFYLGLNAGAGISDSKLDVDPTGAFLTDVNAAAYLASYPGELTSQQAGFTGGLTAGYNWQPNNFVFGVEGDINYLHLTASSSANPPAVPPLGGNVGKLMSLEEDWFGTLRGRLGVAFDRFLVFGTGGLAIGEVKSSAAWTDHGSYNWAASSSSTRAGWVLGAGAEYALTQNWRVKAEYLYVDLGSHSYNVTNATTNPIQTYTINATEWDRYSIVRAGLNYRF